MSFANIAVVIDPKVIILAVGFSAVVGMFFGCTLQESRKGIQSRRCGTNRGLLMFLLCGASRHNTGLSAGMRQRSSRNHGASLDRKKPLLIVIQSAVQAT